MPTKLEELRAVASERLGRAQAAEERERVLIQLTKRQVVALQRAGILIEVLLRAIPEEDRSDHITSLLESYRQSQKELEL